MLPENNDFHFRKGKRSYLRNTSTNNSILPSPFISGNKGNLLSQTRRKSVTPNRMGNVK